MKNKTFIKKLSVIFLLLVIVVSFCSCGKKKEKKPIITKEYEILNVSKYIKAETNILGGVEKNTVCYTFQYLNQNNELITINSFSDQRCELQHVIIGDSNKFITKSRGCINHGEYLQLTEETIRKLDLE